MGYVLLHSAAFLVIAAVLLAPGAIWLRRAFPERLSGGDSALVVLTTGPATWLVVSFALCTAHLLNRATVGLVAFVLVVLALMSRPALFARPRWGGATWLALASTAIVLGAVYLVALNPIPGVDAGHYHLTIPRLYIEVGGFRAIPMSVQSNWPLGIELLYALALLFFDYVAAGLIHFGFGIATSVLLFIACARAEMRAAPWAGAAAVALFWCNPIVQYSGWVANDDLAVAFFFVATFLAVDRAFDPGPNQKAWLLVTGIAAGSLASMKITGIAAVIPSAIWAAFHTRRSGEGPPIRLWIRWAVVPFVALAVLWPIKSWAVTGNPVYPFLYGVFHGPDWSVSLTNRFQQQMRSLGMGRSLTDYLLLPVRVILFSDNDFAHFDGQLSRAWIILVPAAVLLGWRDRFVRGCLAVSGMFFVAWAAGSQQVRYLIPALTTLAVAAAVSMASGMERLAARPRKWISSLGVVAVGALLVAASVPAFKSAESWAGGYLKSGAKMPFGAVAPIYAHLNRTLPPDARVLLINANQAYFVKRDFIVDSFFVASQVASWLSPARTPHEVYDLMRAAGVTHLLVGLESDGTEYPPALNVMLSERTAMKLDYLDRRNGLSLYELCPAFDETSRGECRVAK